MSVRRLLLLLAGAWLTGCAGATVAPPTLSTAGADFIPTERLRVMLPDGDEANGRFVAKRVVGVLQQTHRDVALLPTADAGAALAAARATRAAYLVAPVIVEWTDSHARVPTSDRVAVRLELRDVAAGETVSAVTFENSRARTAGVETQALLDDGFERAVTMLIATGTNPELAPARGPRPALPDPESMDARQFPRQ